MVADTTWSRPSAFDGSAAAMSAHAEAIAALMRGERPLWLGPFAPPAQLPEGYEETALVVPTSGSTGAAKAVALTRAALVASQDASARLLGGHGLWLPLLPPTHIAGIQVIARASRSAQVLGRERPLLPPELPALAQRFDAGSFTAAARGALRAAETAGVPAYTSLVPTQLRRLLDDPSPAGSEALDLLARFTAVLVGGARTDPAQQDRARAAGARIRTTYGSSETAGGCVYDGEPFPGVRLLIDEPSGRLVIVSPTLALGYLRPDGGAEDGAFRTTATGRALLTSDLARLHPAPGGGVRLEILGRADDVIVTGGRKVLPQDVEHAITAHPVLGGLVRECAVLGAPDPEWGEEVVALLVLADPAAAPPDADALRALVRSRLREAGFPAHALPRRIVVVGELPLLGIGKIDRSAARCLVGAPRTTA